MTRLRTSDLEALVAFVGEASSAEGAEPFTPELLDRLATLVPSDGVAFEEVDLGRRALLLKTWSSGSPYRCPPDDGLKLAESHWARMVASPTAAHRRRTGHFGLLKWSDFLSRRQRARLADETEQDGTIDQASVWLVPSLVHKVSLVFVSGGRNFTERDRRVVDVLRPQLAALYGTGDVRRLLAAAVAGLERGSDSERHGVILRGRAGRLELVSARARRLLDDYFDDSGGRLPTQLADWLETPASRPPASPFTIERPGRRLVVHAAGPGISTLLLAEEPAPSVPLTPREWDVMRCVAAGNSNAEIARLLWIAPGTVRKHLEHVYAKLGVHGRTAAVARLQPRLTAD